jgi:hypothetical protein
MTSLPSRDDPGILDRFTTPEGESELLAYRDTDVLWIDVRGRDGKLLGGLGLRTGSTDREVETTAHGYGDWSLAFGAISKRLIRAELRIDGTDEVFPATIVPLLDGLDDDYNAVWGLAESPGRCLVVGYDNLGRPFDGSHPLVPRSTPEPTPEERLTVIRQHVHDSMRHYASWLQAERAPDVIRLLEGNLTTLSNVLALLDGPRLDARSMIALREALAARYRRDAKDEPFEPGQCSFCGGHPVAAYFEGPTFRTYVVSAKDVTSTEAVYVACAACLSLIEADDRDGLAERAARGGTSSPDARRINMVKQQHEDFWSRRDHVGGG